MSFRGDRWCNFQRRLNLAEIVSVELDVAVRCNRRNGEKKRGFSLDRVREKTMGFLSQYVSCVFIFVVYRLVLVSLPCAVQILIRVWVQQEVRPRKARRIRCVIILNVVGVEQFPSIVSVDISVL